MPGLSALGAAVAALVVCAGAYVGGALSIALRFEQGGIWLPHGILIAALLAAPVRRWWLYALALLPLHLHLVATVAGSVPPSIALVQFGADVGVAVVAAAVLRRAIGARARLDSLSRMGAFMVVAAFLAPCVGSALAVGAFAASGLVDDFWIGWQQRVLAQMCGAVIIAPPIVALAKGGMVAVRRASARQIVEAVALTAGLLAALLAPLAWQLPHFHHQWLLFVPLPLLLWSAVRFGPGGLGLHLLAVAVVSLLTAKVGRGPFVSGSTTEIGLALQAFFLAISIPLMLLAALVREHAQAAASLRMSQAEYRSVIEDQTELICRFRADGTYTFVNTAYCRYFKCFPDDLIGQKFWAFLPEYQHAASQAFLASITPEHPVASIEHEVVGPDGESRWQHWTDRGYFDEHGRIMEYQAVGRDITDLKRAAEEHRMLESQMRVADALKEVDRRKDEFLAMLAHELRNPLAPIVTAAEIIRMTGPADPTINWAGDVIARQAAQLKRLVDDLLDVSRITLGKITLNVAALDLGPIVAQAVEATQPLFTARGHQLSIDVPDASVHPLPIRGDAARLAQIISNLLNNAAKFTRDGGRIALKVRRVNSQVLVSVADNGIGIPAHMLERVFEMFMQLDGPGDHPRDGLGIGLALVKRLVEMHDGNIEARSDGPGRGSEFIVRLPLIVERAAGDPARGPAAGVRGAARGARPERVLVVDDNVDAAESLSRMLRLREHEVLVAHDGLAALAVAESMHPDIVLLDIGLPKLDGLEVARRLRGGSEGRRRLLVAMTGFGQAEDRARTAAAGFDHHLTKPVDPQTLYSLMQSARSQSP
jgi:PAS domain S-box-containing protein